MTTPTPQAIDPEADRTWARSQARKVLLAASAVGALAVVMALLFGDSRTALSTAVGAGLGVLNFRLLGLLAQSVLWGGKGKRAMVTGLILKELLLFGGVTAWLIAVRSEPAMLLGFGLGFSAPVLAFVTSPLYVDGAPTSATAAPDSPVAGSSEGPLMEMGS